MIDPIQYVCRLDGMQPVVRDSHPLKDTYVHLADLHEETAELNRYTDMWKRLGTVNDKLVVSVHNERKALAVAKEKIKGLRAQVLLSGMVGVGLTTLFWLVIIAQNTP